MQTNTILRDVSAINGFLDFVIRKGYTAYKIPPKSLPKENRNFRAYIFTDDEIEQMLIAADHTPFAEQNPARKHQIPVIFRILFNCGLPDFPNYLNSVCAMWISKKNVFTILDTKFHKNRLVPFSDSVSEALTQYLEMFPPQFFRFIDFSQFKPSQQWWEVWKQLAAKLNSTSFSEWQGFLIMVQEKVHGFMISGTPLQYTA